MTVENIEDVLQYYITNNMFPRIIGAGVRPLVEESTIPNTASNHEAK
jgi:hypothetical protein